MEALPKESSISKVARYLGTVVCKGGVFSMNQVREAVPGVNQVDRRMRELRELGWRIDTYKTNPSLMPAELQLAEIGDRIWETKTRTHRIAGVSSATRRKIFDRDNNRCQCCGISVGEEYDMYPGRRARLTVGHYLPKERGGNPDDTSNMRTECSLCNETSRNLTPSTVDVSLLRARLRELPRKEKEQFARWIATDRREWSNTEQLWALFRQLPTPARKEIVDELAPYLDARSS